MTLPLTVIHTEAAPKAIGPYSQAIRSGELVFTAGQIPLNPETGALVGGGIGIQTRQALTNLARVLEAAGVVWAGSSKPRCLCKTSASLRP